MKVYFLYIILIFTAINTESKELSVSDDSFNRLLDSGLTANDLHRRDLILPIRFEENPKFKLSIIDKCNKIPLSSLTLSESLANLISSSNSQINESIFAKISNIIDNKKINIITYDDFLANEYINNTLGINLDSAFGFPASLVVKQYLIPILKAYSSFEKDILWSQRKEISYLKKYADSLIYNNSFRTDDPIAFHNTSVRMDSIAKQFFNFSDLTSNSNVHNIGFSLYLHFLKLNQLTMSNIKDFNKVVKTTEIETNLGKIAIGGPGNDEYNGNYILIIELGGNDKYNLTENQKDLILFSPVRSLIDLSGNDVYTGGDYSLGGAYFGFNLLLDYSGDDKYTAGNVSLGSSYFGLGILHDFAGKDTYLGKNFTQGAASFGIGLLIDGKGNDKYNANSFSQGFGFTKGFGLLYDNDGDDNYISKGLVKDITNFEKKPISASQGVGIGFRPYSGGGIGYLIDVSGTDNYTSDLFSQGAAYWYSLGSLFDLNGNDNFNSGSLSQGVGIRNSFGILSDFKGNDKYDSGIISQGFGYDLGFGCMTDFKGNDSYKSKDINLTLNKQPAVSIFVDCNGDDSYTGKIGFQKETETILTENILHINLSIDGSGNNQIHKSNKLSSNSYFIFYPDLLLPANIDYQNRADSITKSNLPKSLDSLYIISISRLGEYEKLIFQARDSISQLNFDSINSIFNFDDKLNNNQLSAYEYVLNRVFMKKNEIARNAILDSLKTNDVGKFGVWSRVMSRYFPNESKLHLTLRLNDINPEIQELAIIALTKIEQQSVADNISQFLVDDNPYIRAKAANSIGTLKQNGYLNALTNAFLDSMQIVRKSAFRGVISNLSPDFAFIKNFLNVDYPLEVKQKLLYTIVNADLKEKEFQEFLKILSLQISDLRYAFYREILNEKNPKWIKRIPQLIKNETDSELINILKNE